MADQPVPAGPQQLSATGVLTPEQIAATKIWLEQKWTAGGCPFHGPTTWEIDNHAAIVPAGPVLGGTVFTLIVVSCAICRFTVFVNGLTAGIFAPGIAPVATPTIIPIEASETETAGS